IRRCGALRNRMRSSLWTLWRRQKTERRLDPLEAAREETSLPEAAGRDAAMLGVMHANLLPDRAGKLLRQLFVARAEVPDLRSHAAYDVQRKLALVRLAEPALLRELLQNTGALALGVRPREREPGPQHRRKNDECQQDEADFRIAAPLFEALDHDRPSRGLEPGPFRGPGAGVWP